MESIVLYSDGACSGNPGSGGWGSVLIFGPKVIELGGGERLTTNNKMELSGLIFGLRYLLENKLHLNSKVTAYTDSTYVIRGITQWVHGWRRRGWTTAEGQPVANKEYWIELSDLVKNFDLQFKYVAGHKGIPGNERCDTIAVAYSKGDYVSLYQGAASNYLFDVTELPPDVPLPEMKSKTGEKKSAYSYLSMIGSSAIRHRDWPSCERRVKGKAGARFKKAMSAQDEAEILRSWGVLDPSSVKSE